LCFVLDWQVIYILTQSEDFLLIGKAFFEPRDYRVVFVLQKSAVQMYGAKKRLRKSLPTSQYRSKGTLPFLS